MGSVGVALGSIGLPNLSANAKGRIGRFEDLVAEKGEVVILNLSVFAWTTLLCTALLCGMFTKFVWTGVWPCGLSTVVE